jgi:hypothetical protein
MSKLVRYFTRQGISRHIAYHYAHILQAYYRGSIPVASLSARLTHAVNDFRLI